MTPANTPLADRRVSPPGSEAYVRPPALLCVTVADDEDVEWIWAHTADGRSVVSGYRIVPKLPLGLRTLLSNEGRGYV